MFNINVGTHLLVCFRFDLPRNVSALSCMKAYIRVNMLITLKIIVCHFVHPPAMKTKWSFSVIYKFKIFVLLEFENKLDIGINNFNFNSKYHGKCEFVLKLIRHLFPLEIVQK